MSLFFFFFYLVFICFTFSKTVEIAWAIGYHETVKIHVGDTIQWNFNGFHSVISQNSPSFTSSGTQSGGTYSITFNTVGSYYYICGVHGASQQDGTIIVRYATYMPSYMPSINPSSNPTVEPTIVPTANPTDATIFPSINPTSNPTDATIIPTTNPSINPIISPTANPTDATLNPTKQPTAVDSGDDDDNVVKTTSTVTVLDSGGIKVSLDVLINLTTNMVKLTLIGPSNRWYGIGFSTSSGIKMGGAYAIICLQNNMVKAQRLASFSQGTNIDTYQSKSNNIANNIRTVVIEETLAKFKTDGIEFPTVSGKIYYIAAYGISGQTFDAATGMGARQTSQPLDLVKSGNMTTTKDQTDSASHIYLSNIYLYIIFVTIAIAFINM